jgi:hypothetical protein
MPYARKPPHAPTEEHPPAPSPATRAAYGIAATSVVVIAGASLGAFLLWPTGSPFGNVGTLFGIYFGVLAGVVVAAFVGIVWLIWLLLRFAFKAWRQAPN